MLNSFGTSWPLFFRVLSEQKRTGTLKHRQQLHPSKEACKRCFSGESTSGWTQYHRVERLMACPVISSPIGETPDARYDLVGFAECMFDAN